MEIEGLTTDQAIRMAQSSWWVGMSPRDVAMFQLHERRICMPISKLIDCLQEALGRPVWHHELCSDSIGGLRAELRGDRRAPTFHEIVSLIPEDKRILIET
jgi:hypothetical protein